MRKFIPGRYESRYAVICFLLVSGTNMLHAQEQTDVHPYLANKFFIDLGIYFPDRETRLGVDGAISGVNDDFEFERVTGGKERDETFAMDFGWQFGKKWSLLLQYFESTDTKGAVLTEDIQWKDIVFAQGRNAVIGQEFSVTRVFFGRKFNTSARHDFGAGLGCSSNQIQRVYPGRNSDNRWSQRTSCGISKRRAAIAQHRHLVQIFVIAELGVQESL